VDAVSFNTIAAIDWMVRLRKSEKISNSNIVGLHVQTLSDAVTTPVCVCVCVYARACAHVRMCVCAFVVL